MSTFKVQKVEFEPPIKGGQVEPFDGWVCVGYCDEKGTWHSGCDVDSPDDAYHSATQEGVVDLHPATVQMFRVDPA